MLSVVVIPQSSKAPGSIPFKSLFEGISFGGACNRKGNCNSESHGLLTEEKFCQVIFKMQMIILGA